jgi:hypothetical protein
MAQGLFIKQPAPNPNEPIATIMNIMPIALAPLLNASITEANETANMMVALERTVFRDLTFSVMIFSSEFEIKLRSTQQGEILPQYVRYLRIILAVHFPTSPLLF